MRAGLAAILICCAMALAMGGALNLGGLITSGNTDVKQLDTGLEITGQPSVFLATGLALSASYGSQEGESYLEKYLAEGSLKYGFSDNDYIASRAYWTRDLFSGVNREYGATAGYGRMLVAGGDFTASLEAGAGYLSRENTLEEELSTSTWYGGTELGWDISDSWTIRESARFTGDLQDSGNHSVESVTEAVSSITGSLSFLLGYDVTYHNQPPVPGNEKTDASLRIQLRLEI